MVETYAGGGFDLFDPDPADVRLADIAAGLAHTCRFGGQCRQFYGVAHHSLYASRELPDDARLRAIGPLHDAGEAYVGDVPRPLTAEHEAFERIEARVPEAVRAALDVDPPDETDWERVMAADDRLLVHEADAILEDCSRAGRLLGRP